MAKIKLHKGKKQECPKCREEMLGLDECFRRISGKK